MSDNRTPSWRHVRRQFLFALALSLFALFIFSIFSLSPSEGFRSAELQFTDASAGGLAIVPASCPSFPHYIQGGNAGVSGDGVNECEGVAPDANCTIRANPSSINPLGGGAFEGSQSTLSWTTDETFIGFGENSVLTSVGSIDNGIGSVSSPGSTVVAPLVSTRYTYAGTQYLLFVPVRNFSCSTAVTVVGRPFNAAPAGGGAASCVSGYYCAGSDLYYRASCNAAGQLIQSCTYGCSGGACLVPPPPSGSIRAVPALVRSGDTTQVSWSAANVSSCTVSGSNSDSWSGASGSQLSAAIVAQTTYTLSCTGLDGSTFVQSAVVNIIPIFQET